MARTNVPPKCEWKHNENKTQSHTFKKNIFIEDALLQDLTEGVWLYIRNVYPNIGVSQVLWQGPEEDRTPWHKHVFMRLDFFFFFSDDKRDVSTDLITQQK